MPRPWRAAPSSRPFYSQTGRPSVDPELMVRMLIVGYSFGIRSERRLCEEVHLNLAYRWFCRLGLEEAVPDHSTLSRFRSHLVARGLGERLLEALNRQLEERGLMLKRGTLLDATVVAAAVKPPAGPKGSVAPGPGRAAGPGRRVEHA